MNKTEGENAPSGLSSGSATILALLITGVIITVGIGFNWIVKENLKAAEGMKRKSEAMVKAFSTYNTLIYSILAGTTTERDLVFADGGKLLGVKSIPLNNAGVAVGGDVEVKIQDSNGMISLTNADPGTLQRLLRNLSPGQDNSAVIVDSYLDWIGSGGMGRLNRTTAAYYKAQGKPYTARNYSLQYKEEFSLVRGMDQALYKKVSPYLTMLPNSGFNPNTAPDAVLAAYLYIDADAMRDLRNRMLQSPVSSNTDLFNIVGRTIAGEGFDFFPSRFWDITINVGKPEPVYSLKAGIDIRWNPTYPYSVIYWEKG